VLRKQKFYLSFEPAEEVDYVTEKVYHALAAGAVPVRGLPRATVCSDRR
jgi:hypothetical protein